MPVPVCDVKVVDPDGTALPVGDVGELWIFGPNVVKGYFNKPVETAASFTAGWLHSGDVARLDDEGLRLYRRPGQGHDHPRRRERVLRRGRSPLYEHPAVNDAAVIGIPHQVLGEEVGAVVYVLPGMDVTEAELQAHVAERLAAFKVPVRIWFRPEPCPETRPARS